MAMQTFVSYESRFSRIYAKQLFIIQTLVKHSMLFSYIGLSKCDCMQMNVLQTLIARFHHPFLFPVSEENTSFLEKKEINNPFEPDVESLLQMSRPKKMADLRSEGTALQRHRLPSATEQSRNEHALNLVTTPELRFRSITDHNHFVNPIAVARTQPAAFPFQRQQYGIFSFH
jgi:hypothetical protein